MAQKTAVIIDDEPDITTYFETLLIDNGWSVRTANDPNAGNDPFGQDGGDVQDGDGGDAAADFDFESLFGDADQDNDGDVDAEDLSTKASEKAKAKATADAKTKGKAKFGKSLAVAEKVGETIGHVTKALVKIDL